MSAQILLIGGEQDALLLRTRALLAAPGKRVHLVANAAEARLSLALGSTAVRTLVVVDGEPLPMAGIECIVVTQLAAVASPLLAADDQSYASAEALAAWLAFLASAPCRVVNRPSANYNILLQSPLHVRAFARHHVPTVDDLIVDGRALAGRRRRGERSAAIDLSNDQPFWLASSYAPASGSLVSLIDHDEAAPFAVTLRVGADCLTVPYGPAAQAPLRPDARAQAEQAAVTLLDALGLDLGCCVFSLSDTIARFSRLFTGAWPFVGEQALDWAAERLAALALAEQGSRHA